MGTRSAKCFLYPRSHAPAWKCIPLLRPSLVWLTTKIVGTRSAKSFLFPRSHAPAWECIPQLRSSSVWATTETVGTRSFCFLFTNLNSGTKRRVYGKYFLDHLMPLPHGCGVVDSAGAHCRWMALVSLQGCIYGVSWKCSPCTRCVLPHTNTLNQPVITVIPLRQIEPRITSVGRMPTRKHNIFLHAYR